MRGRFLRSAKRNIPVLTTKRGSARLAPLESKMGVNTVTYEMTEKHMYMQYLTSRPSSKRDGGECTNDVLRRYLAKIRRR